MTNVIKISPQLEQAIAFMEKEGAVTAAQVRDMLKTGSNAGSYVVYQLKALGVIKEDKKVLGKTKTGKTQRMQSYSLNEKSKLLESHRKKVADPNYVALPLLERKDYDVSAPRSRVPELARMIHRIEALLDEARNLEGKFISKKDLRLLAKIKQSGLNIKF